MLVNFFTIFSVILCISRAEENSCSRLLLQALNENTNATGEISQINGTSHVNVTVLTLPCLDYLSDEMLTKQVIKDEIDKNQHSRKIENNGTASVKKEKLTGNFKKHLLKFTINLA